MDSINSFESRRYNRRINFSPYRDRYDIIKSSNIKDDGNIKFFEIGRSDLDEIIRIAFIIKNSNISTVDQVFSDDEKRKDIEFYDLDMDALDKMQHDFGFILANTSGLNNDRRSITFRGILFEQNRPTNKQAHLKINDLDRLSSLRFAFSAYHVMQRNNSRYSMVINLKGMCANPRIIMQLDAYFDYALKDYFDGKKS